MTTATFIRFLPDWQSDARLYELSAPIGVGWEPLDGPDDRPRTNFVVIAAGAPYGYPETLTFAADAEGKVLSWADGPGSHRGDLDHSAAIAQAGWKEEQ